MNLTIRCVNSYEDGSESTLIHHVVVDYDSSDDLELLWDELWVYTGDGSGENMEAFYEVTIVSADDEALVGLTNEWG